MRKKWIPVIAGAVVAILIIMVVRIVWNPAAKETKKGIEYLKELETKDIDTVEKKVKLVKKEAQAEAVANGELSVWAQFSDYVIFGDSRTVGFSYYEFLDKQRVLAEAGLTIANIPDYMNQIKTLNPSHIFLCTGLNDVSIGLWKTPEEYVTDYEQKVQEIKKNLPDAHIYINSIFPAQEPAFQKSAKWKDIPQYAQAVKKWCEEKGYNYIDNTDVFEDHKDLYDADGIHFQKAFYEYWAINMLAEVEL